MRVRVRVRVRVMVMVRVRVRVRVSLVYYLALSPHYSPLTRYRYPLEWGAVVISDMACAAILNSIKIVKTRFFSVV